MSRKVLITSRSFGSISSRPMDILKEAGYEVVHKGASFNQEEFNRIVPDFDVLIIGGHPFPEDVMEKCTKMKLICKHGAGLDNIPLKKAAECGIAVCNAPGTNSNAVADLAFGLMLACARKIVYADKQVHAGSWKTVTGIDVYGKTLGLLGFGAIAKNVARRAKGFSMKVLAYDPYLKELPEEFRDYVTLTDKEAVIAGCDFLSAHMPLTDETRGMISAEAMKTMRPGSVIINTARGGIVDETALYEAIQSGQIGGAGMDVSEKEPVTAENPLFSLDNVVITSHIGMYSKEAIEAVSIICAENAAAMAAGGELQFRVKC